MIPSRAAVAAAGAFALAGSLALGAWWIYDNGFEAGQARADARLVAARLQAEQERADALARLTQANADMVKLQADTTRRIAEIEKRTPVRVRTVERVIRENPDFASVVRPDDLARLRDEQTAELVDAAGRGSDLSRRILSGLPGAADGVGSVAGRD